jgi:O-antigen ligase
MCSRRISKAGWRSGRALYGIQDFPFTGMGMGTFRQVVHVLYPLFLTSPDVDLGHAHNEFLQATLDLGIPGLTAFLALQGMALALAYKTFRSTAPNWMRWTAAGALAGLVAHDVYGLTDAVALGAKPGVLFWMLLGLIAVLFEQARSSQPET